jgi:DNA-binding HxlR family transcriptional regulator
MKRRHLAETGCPVARGAAQLVDAWTFTILRELFLGRRRFEALRQHTGMSPRSLSLRLAHLVEQGVLERQLLADGDAPANAHEYRLTPKGLDLWPLLMLMRQWGERWAGPWPQPLPAGLLQHRGHGHALRVRVVCETCGEPVDARAAERLVRPAAASGVLPGELLQEARKPVGRRRADGVRAQQADRRERQCG